MKRSPRRIPSPIEDRFFAAIAGFVLGVMGSPIGWWAFRVSDWKAGAVVSLVFAVLTAIAAGVLKPKSFESLVETVLRILNPH